MALSRICTDSLRMADDDQKLKAARERMSRLREEAKDVEIARIQHAIKVSCSATARAIRRWWRQKR